MQKQEEAVKERKRSLQGQEERLKESEVNLANKEADLKMREEQLEKEATDVRRRERDVAEKEETLREERGVFFDAKRRYLDWEKEGDRLRRQMEKLEKILTKLGYGWVLKEALSTG